MYSGIRYFFWLATIPALLLTQCRPPEDPPLECKEALTPYNLDIPDCFPPMDLPEDNPMTVEGVELGRRLFYDPILSKDSTQSCATCHMDFASFSDTARFSTGVEGMKGTRNAMAILNIGWSFALFWDGRSPTVEAQVLEPVPNPIEMNLDWFTAMDRLNNHPYYKKEFKRVFGTDFIDSNHVAKAIAQFERTMISGNSKFDRASCGGGEVLTELERDGQVIFFTEKGDCYHCHGTSLFMGFTYHNNGLQATIVDSGLGAITGLPTDIGKFKPPTLRNIELTAPYMHDGRFKTLEEVVEFYNSGVNQNSPNISLMMLKSNRPGGNLGLTEYEKQALVAFLKTLTDTSFINNPAFQNPF